VAVRALALAATLGTLMLAAGCGGTPVPGSAEDATAVRDTVRRHQVAVFAGDGSMACGTTVGRARRQLMRFHAQPPSARRPSCEELIRAFGRSISARDGQSAGRIRVSEVRIDGDGATAVIDETGGEVEGEEEGVTYRLRRTEDGWAISDFGPVVAELAEAFGDAADALDTAWRLDCRTFRFDPAAWRRARRSLKDDAPTADQRLADALIKCRTLIGKPRSEVIALLGPSDSGGVPLDDDRRSELAYATGPQRGSCIAIDSEYMTIYLDRGGRVRLVELAAD
jgi:hypothetical protein